MSKEDKYECRKHEHYHRSEPCYVCALESRLEKLDGEVIKIKRQLLSHAEQICELESPPAPKEFKDNYCWQCPKCMEIIPLRALEGNVNIAINHKCKPAPKAESELEKILLRSTSGNNEQMYFLRENIKDIANQIRALFKKKIEEANCDFVLTRKSTCDVMALSDYLKSINEA